MLVTSAVVSSQFAAAAVIAGRSALPIAAAENYPARPVRIIVAFAPGGPTDIVGRLIALKLADRLGQQFYVENIGGGGGNIGTVRAAQATPDGYTMLFAANTIAINPSLYDKVSYDLDKDFDPVSLAVSSASLLTVHPSVPAQTVKELVAQIAGNPGKYSYATPGVGTPPHLLGELLRLSFKLDLVHVPFNGGGLAIASTVAGHTPISFGAAAPAVPFIADGKLRALAVTTSKRTPILPDVPTMAEAGFPGIVGEAWFGLLAPAGTAEADRRAAASRDRQRSWRCPTSRNGWRRSASTRSPIRPTSSPPRSRPTPRNGARSSATPASSRADIRRAISYIRRLVGDRLGAR